MWLISQVYLRVSCSGREDVVYDAQSAEMYLLDIFFSIFTPIY